MMFCKIKLFFHNHDIVIVDNILIIISITIPKIIITIIF